MLKGTGETIGYLGAYVNQGQAFTVLPRANAGAVTAQFNATTGYCDLAISGYYIALESGSLSPGSGILCSDTTGARVDGTPVANPPGTSCH